MVGASVRLLRLIESLRILRVPIVSQIVLIVIMIVRRRMGLIVVRVVVIMELRKRYRKLRL